MNIIYILFIAIFIVNIITLWSRRSKIRKKRSIDAEECANAERQFTEISRKLVREQEEAARRVERQNKMFEMYEEVRRRTGEVESSDRNKPEQ